MDSKQKNPFFASQPANHRIRGNEISTECQTSGNSMCVSLSCSNSTDSLSSSIHCCYPANVVGNIFARKKIRLSGMKISGFSWTHDSSENIHYSGGKLERFSRFLWAQNAFKLYRSIWRSNFSLQYVDVYMRKCAESKQNRSAVNETREKMP